MKVKVGILSATFPQLTEFVNTEMSTALALRIRRVVKVARSELETFSEQEKASAESLGGVLEQKENFAYFKFTDTAKQEEYVQGIAKAREVDIELPGDALKESEVLAGVKTIKPAVLADLDWLIVAD